MFFFLITNAAITFLQVYDVKDASMVKVVPTSNNGSPEIVSLQSTVCTYI